MGNKLENLGEQQHDLCYFSPPMCFIWIQQIQRIPRRDWWVHWPGEPGRWPRGYASHGGFLGVPPNHPCFGFSMINIDKPNILGYPHDLGKTISLKCIRNQPFIHHVIFPHPQSPRRSSSSAPLRPSRLAWLQPSHPTASLWLRVIHGKPWFIHMLFFDKEI